MRQLQPGTPSPERLAWNSAVRDFALNTAPETRVADIGVPKAWCYRDEFENRQAVYHVLDRDKDMSPDVVVDLELETHNWREKYDAVLCNGVTEQCNNPFLLVDGIHRICREGAECLWGVCGPGYPEYGQNDKFRFTQHGIVDVLSDSGFDVIKMTPVKRGTTNSYFIILCVTV